MKRPTGLTEEESDKRIYKFQRDEWLDKRFVPPINHPKRNKKDRHHFNTELFDLIYQMGREEIFGIGV